MLSEISSKRLTNLKCVLFLLLFILTKGLAVHKVDKESTFAHSGYFQAFLGSVVEAVHYELRSAFMGGKDEEERRNRFRPGMLAEIFF